METPRSGLPTTIGRFHIEALLGSGGMGDVYKALDPTLHRTVAVKTVRPDMIGRDALDRLYREAQACARLQHPNIVTVFEAGETDGVVYIAMEYLKGENLATVLQRGGVSLEEKLRILSQILEALQHAHTEDVIHRDIKPSNIHRLSDGTVKLLDFGLARMTHLDTLTASGAILGTLHYASPEQLRAEPVDRRTDIYSTGALAYQMISGRLPFEGDNASAGAIVLKVLSEVPPPIGRWCTEQFPEIERLVSRAMAKSPADRYQTAAEMRDALQAFMASSGEAITAAAATAGEDAPTVFGPAGLKSRPPATGLKAGPPATGLESRLPESTSPRRMAWFSAAAIALAITAVTAVTIAQFVRTSGQRAADVPLPGVDAFPRPPAGDPSSTQPGVSGASVTAPQTPESLPRPADGSAQSEGVVSAKQLFFAAPAATAASGASAAPAVLGLKYRVMKHTSGDAEIEADPETVFRSGDRVRFAFESNIDGYLYVVQQGSSGRWTLLFPHPDINGGSNAIRRMQSYLVPPDTYFEFDETPGIERVFVFLNKEPVGELPGFDRPVTRAETVTAAVMEDLDRIRSRDLRLVVEKDRTDRRAANAKPNEATYVVNRDEVGKAVAAVIQLRHGQ